MRVPGHGRLGLLFCPGEHGHREATDRGHGFEARVGDVKPQGGCNLIVARASGVDLAADRAEKPLDRGMNILVVRLGPSFHGDPVEGGLDIGELGIGEQTAFMQAARMNTRRQAVVREQLGVVGAQEVPDRLRDLGIHSSGPEGHATWTCFRSATSSVSSAVIPMKPSAASCGNVSPMPYEASDSE